MKKILIVVMMCLTNVFAISAIASAYSKKCTVHYTVVNEDGGVVWGPADVTADTCDGAAKVARYLYFIASGDTSVY